jgi:hypothetical protein
MRRARASGRVLRLPDAGRAGVQDPLGSRVPVSSDVATSRVTRVEPRLQPTGRCSGKGCANSSSPSHSRTTCGRSGGRSNWSGSSLTTGRSISWRRRSCSRSVPSGSTATRLLTGQNFPRNTSRLGPEQLLTYSRSGVLRTGFRQQQREMRRDEDVRTLTAAEGNSFGFVGARSGTTSGRARRAVLDRASLPANVDAKMVHGWPLPLPRGVDLSLVGRARLVQIAEAPARS